MVLSDRQILFLNFVKLKHGEQKRKYTGEPYWHHVYAVAEIVSEYDTGAIEIALGHDLFEDTDCGYHELITFLISIGYKSEWRDIADGILELTDQFTHHKYPHINRKGRKEKEAERLSQITSRSQTVKYADIINNTSSIVENDKDFAKIYLKEIADTLRGMQFGNTELFNRCMLVVTDATAKLNDSNQLDLFGEKKTGGHYFHSVDSKDYDFVVYNQDAFELTNEDIEPEDLVPLKYKELTPTIQRLKSEAWSCGCKWFFVIQPEGIYLMNVHDEHFWFCKKLSHKFFKMYLDAPAMAQKEKLKLPEEKKTGEGKLWCTACEKTPGFHTYIDFRGDVQTVVCPICKGTRQYTFKGKAPADRK